MKPELGFSPLGQRERVQRRLAADPGGAGGSRFEVSLDATWLGGAGDDPAPENTNRLELGVRL